MRHAHIAARSVSVVILALATFINAAVWTVDGTDSLLPALDRLEMCNVSFHSDNTVTLAPALTELAILNDAAVWQVGQDRAGALWLATGNSARVYRLARTGARPELVFDGTTGEILALTVGPDGTVYFGRTPEGTIYRIRPGATPESLLATGESYIFSLLTDRNGTLYCATGSQGRLLTISPSGRLRTVFSASQTHLTTMHWLVPDKELLVGTSPDGVVYHLDFSVDHAHPGVSVLYDTPLDEVRAVTSDQNRRVYVAANSAAASGAEAAATRVFALDSSYLAWSWTCPESLIFCLSLRRSAAGERRLLVGTGHRGVVYELDYQGRASTLQRLAETQVLSFLPSNPRLLGSSTPLWLSTGNTARLYELGTGYADSGCLVSPPQDCNNPARFGSLTFRATIPAGTALEFDTRTGAAQKPDTNWSNWVRVHDRVRSPAARFVQWRARFSSRFPSLTPALSRTDLFYGPVNRPPQIKRLDVAMVPPAEARRGSANPRRTVTWEASDPDSDSLIYELLFRAETETRWKPLARDLAESRYEVDTRALPDGWYVIRLVASDRLDQPRDLVLTDEHTSKAFPVDNTPPRILDLTLRAAGQDRYRVSFVARDTLSPIVSGRVSVNAGDWRAVGPDDGLLDSREERFVTELSLTPGEGESVVSAWVADAQGNVGVASTVVRR
jgi:hypothetical protein